MNDVSGLWGWVPVLGMVVLGAVMLFGILSNRRHNSKREIDRTEEATKVVRDQTDRETQD